MGTSMSKQPPLLTYGFGETVDYLEHFEFKEKPYSLVKNKKCRKEIDQMGPTLFLSWEDIC